MARAFFRWERMRQFERLGFLFGGLARGFPQAEFFPFGRAKKTVRLTEVKPHPFEDS